MKPSSVARAFDNCAVGWVEQGVSVRKLSIAESLKARSEQARLREPLAYAEIFGLNVIPPAGSMQAFRESRRMAREANLVDAGKLCWL